MSRQDVTALKPFFSVLIIIASLFSLVFFNMETPGLVTAFPQIKLRFF